MPTFLSEEESFQALHKQIKDFLQLNASTAIGIISRLEKKRVVARLPKRRMIRVGIITITQALMLQSSFDTIIDFLNIENIDAAPIITGLVDAPMTGVPKVER